MVAYSPYLNANDRQVYVFALVSLGGLAHVSSVVNFQSGMDLGDIPWVVVLVSLLFLLPIGAMVWTRARHSLVKEFISSGFLNASNLLASPRN
jgi:hypothetical protein